MKIESQAFAFYLSTAVLYFRGTTAGIPTMKDTVNNKNDNRIVGGNPVQPGEYPYFVNLDGCGGSLIAPTVVLTAAHCEPSFYVGSKVTVGASSGKSLNNGNFKEAKRIKVKKVVSHPKYGKQGSDINNDFALMMLSEPYNIESNIKLLLNDQDSVPVNDEVLTVFGLGSTQEGGNLSSKLRDVQVPAIPNNECKNYYGNEVTDKMLCAGFKQGTKDSCQGDSGGPLVKIADNTHYQVGVVSWGDGCARPNAPGVYARVSTEYNWIKQVVCDDWNVQGADLCGGSGSSPTPPSPTPPVSQPTIPSPTPDNEEQEPDNSGCASGGSDFLLGFDFDLFSDDISWKVKLGGTKIASNRGYGANKTDAYELLTLCNDNCYSVTIDDFFGDGLCCDSGDGGYFIDINGNPTFEGSKFGSRVVEDFCLDTNGAVTTLNDVNVCEDGLLAFKDKPNKDCEWVAGNLKRCKKKSGGVKVKNICKSTCGNC